jgi:hypothetical protein
MAIAGWGAPQQGIAYRLALALPFGLVAWAWFCIVFLLLMSVPYHNALYVPAFTVTAMAAYFVAVRAIKPAVVEHLLLAVAVGAAVLIATQVSIVFLSYDSFVMQYMADQIAMHSGLTAEIRGMALHLSLLQAFIALPALAGQPHIPPAPILNTPLLVTIHCVVAFGFMAWRIVGRGFADRTAGVVFCVVLPLSLLLSRHMTMQVFYFNNHIIAAFGFLILAVAARSPAEVGLRPGVIVLTAYATLLIARMEAVVFLALVPFVFRGAGGAMPDMRRAWAGGAILTTLLLGYYFAGAAASPGSNMVPRTNWLVPIAIAWGVWFALLDLRVSKFAFNLAIPAYICGCVALFVFGFWRDAPAMASGVDAAIRNIFLFRAQWDFTWTVLLALTAIAGALMPAAVLRNPWLVYTGLFFLGLIALNALRLHFPYRYNWYDSGARMAVHVLPIAAIGVACLWRDLIVSRTQAGRLAFKDVAKSA